MANWQYTNKPDAGFSTLTSKGSTFGPIDQGYYVNTPNIDPADRGANGQLTNQDGDTLGLWVTDVSASFSIGGTTAQSPMRREFYPRNFVQPKLMIGGQMPNSFQYQRLAEFVRLTQLKSLDPNADIVNAKDLAGLTIYPGGDNHNSSNEVTSANANMNGANKGQHIGAHVRGYVSSIQRGAQMGVNAPTFEFEFVVAYSYSGLFAQGQYNPKALTSWVQTFLSGPNTPDPDSTTPVLSIQVPQVPITPPPFPTLSGPFSGIPQPLSGLK